MTALSAQKGLSESAQNGLSESAQKFLSESHQRRLSESKDVIHGLAVTLKSEFFAVIKDFCGKSVAKYWLTGVLPAFRDGISALTATEVIGSQERYQSLCGLTQEDVDALVKRALGNCPEEVRKSTLSNLKHWYDGYMFNSTSSSSEKLALYNPQLVFVHLKNIISGSALQSFTEEANAIHTSTVLSVVGVDGLVTVHDLIDMLYSTAEAEILTELSFDELMRAQNERPKDVTWSLLYYLGIVTYHHNSSAVQTGRHTLWVPNRTMFHLVGPRMSCLGEF